MSPAVLVFRFVVSAITGLSGTMINSLVLTLYLLQWKISSKLVVYDQIQISIALTHLILQGCLTVDGMMDTLRMFLNLDKNISLFLFILTSSFYASAWNTAWLSIYFCVRLVNCSHPYLLRMKSMFLSCVPQLMVGSVLGSIIINVPSFWLTEVNPLQNKTLLTIITYDVTIHFDYTISISFLGSLLPLTLTCLCISQCVTSLMRHVWRIKLSESHLTASQLQGHIRATRIMIMRVLLDLTFYVLATVIALTSFRLSGGFAYSSWIITQTFPTAQSLILILGNPKLKSKIFRRCAFK